jgi:hypothetical protein
MVALGWGELPTWVKRQLGRNKLPNLRHYWSFRLLDKADRRVLTNPTSVDQPDGRPKLERRHRRAYPARTGRSSHCAAVIGHWQCAQIDAFAVE